MPTPESFVPVAITRRSGFDESVHFGAVVGLSVDGRDRVRASAIPTTAIYPRSSNKPMQAVAMVRAGLHLPPDLLALVCASHDGTPVHLDAARRILATAGLDERSLANTRRPPARRCGSPRPCCAPAEGRTSLQMNCSGKHSGMLVTSARQRLADRRRRTSRPSIRCSCRSPRRSTSSPANAHRHIGVDGCGSPAHVISLLGLARAFRAIATGAAGIAGDAVYPAMTAHPEMVGGDERDVTQFMRSVPGLMAKDGADGVFAAALPDGRAVAHEDRRRRQPGAAAGDARRAACSSASTRPAVEPMVTQWILGHGAHVGEVRAIAP